MARNVNTPCIGDTIKITREVNGFFVATRKGIAYNLLIVNGAMSVFSQGGYYSHVLNQTGWTVTVRECRGWAHVPGITCRCCGV